MTKGRLYLEKKRAEFIKEFEGKDGFEAGIKIIDLMIEASENLSKEQMYEVIGEIQEKLINKQKEFKNDKRTESN